LLDVNRRLSA